MNGVHLLIGVCVLMILALIALERQDK